MTYPIPGAGVFTNSGGPYTLSTGSAVSGGSSGISVEGTPPGVPPVQTNTPSGVSLPAYNWTNGWNFTNGKLAVQADPDQIGDGVQQGVNAVSNVTAVTLAGYPATAYGSTGFVQWAGPYRSE